jgi:Na+-transporting methylmalonyl-CoA/oxaloacetate decarboxylase beta subunit
MEKSVTEKLTKLMQSVNKGDLKDLSEALDKALGGAGLGTTEIRAKVSWVLGNSEDPANFLSIDFKIG